MPWHVEQGGGTCGSSQWAVINSESGATEGCHATKGDAEKQMAALYASEEDSMSSETKFAAPRDDLIRGLTEVRANGDGNTMTGYPVVFNTWTTIDSWEGKFRERIHPGAVTKTLKERGDQVKVQFDHGMHPVIGSLPLGKPEVMRSDDIGLWTEVPLSRAEDVQNLIKPRIQEGSIDGMSFRFSVKREEWDKEDSDLPERTILELALFEFGPVTWPAYEATQVGIRGQAAFAAWMQQTPEERAATMRQFDLEPRREIIRVRSGAVEVDASDSIGEELRVAEPEPEQSREDCPEPPDDTEPRDVDEDEPAEGHSSDEEHRDEPDEDHSTQDSDTPAESHLSPPEEEPKREDEPRTKVAESYDMVKAMRERRERADALTKSP